MSEEQQSGYMLQYLQTHKENKHEDLKKIHLNFLQT